MASSAYNITGCNAIKVDDQHISDFNYIAAVTTVLANQLEQVRDASPEESTVVIAIKSPPKIM